MKTAYLEIGMHDVATTDFPFVVDLPKREKSRLVKLWDTFKEISSIQQQHGFLVPRSAVAALLELHPTRIDQLCEAGKLTRIDYHGHRYITENSLVEFARIERKNGRPQKVIDDCAKSPLAAMKVARKFGQK